MTTRTSIPVEQFGKDHWSTLAYVETRCVDFAGVLGKDQMRCNMNRHADMAGPHQQRSLVMKWQEKYGTVLNTGTIIVHHDDWDCLEDLIAAGFVEPIIPTYEGMVCMTEEGTRVAQLIRVFKSQGGRYADFRLPIEELKTKAE